MINILENSLLTRKDNLITKINSTPFLERKRKIGDVVKLTVINYVIPLYNAVKNKVLLQVKYYDNLKREFYPRIDIIR